MPVMVLSKRGLQDNRSVRPLTPREGHDQIWRNFKVLGKKILSKVAIILGDILGYFENDSFVKHCCGYLLGNVWRKFGYFLANFWSHWS